MKLYLKSCERFHWPFDDAIYTHRAFCNNAGLCGLTAKCFGGN